MTSRLGTSKLFGKRLLKTSRLVASTQVLTNSAIPTNDCDVVVTFPTYPDTNVLMWLLDRLRERTPDIIVHVRHHSNTKGPVLHLTATHNRDVAQKDISRYSTLLDITYITGLNTTGHDTQDHILVIVGLLKVAEELAIRKPLKEEYGGGMKEFNFEAQDCFSGTDDSEEFFSSQERQSIIHYMLNNLRATKGEILGTIRFLEGQAIRNSHKKEKVHIVGYRQMIQRVPLLETRHIISQVFPLHSTDDLTELREGWIQKFFSRQPLNKICDYFGVKIAMYFAYLGHYTTALCVPAFIGFLIWFIQGEDEGADDFDLVIFALFNALWATLYLEHWKRKSSELAYEWGTLDKKDELLEDPRPLFTGDLVESPVTGRLEPYYPQWKRNLFRYFVSLPVILLCLVVVFVVMLLIFQFQEWINVKVDADNYLGFLTFLPKILLAICIGIFDEIYKKIAYWLNDMENYRMDESYENHLITKLAIFVNSFLSLFYIAFYLQDMDRLSDQLAAILITRQILGNIKEALLPYLQWQARLCKVGYELVGDLSPGTPSKGDNSFEKECYKEALDGAELRHRTVSFEETSIPKRDDNLETNKTGYRRDSIYVKRSLSLTQAEVESEMKEYEDTLQDHLEMLIQFGYVTLFSSAFPLAALCALLNNVIEIRSDAFKLCMNHQRPFGKRVESIGTWQDALELMGLIAVVVNCALIGVSGQIKRLLPVTELSTTIIIIVILEHIILAIKLLIAYAIPDVPEAIATKKAKLEFLRRIAFKKLESQVTNCSSVKETNLSKQLSKNNIIQQGKQTLYGDQRSSTNHVTPTNCRNSFNGNNSNSYERNYIDNVRCSAIIKNVIETEDISRTDESRDHVQTVMNDRKDRKKTCVHDSCSIKNVSNLNTGHNNVYSSLNRGKEEYCNTKSTSISHSLDNEQIEKYINTSTGTIDRTQSLPDEQIKQLLANSEKRSSGTYISSMTIPLQSTTQRKTVFSVVKTGQSSCIVPHKLSQPGSKDSQLSNFDKKKT